MKWKLDEKGEHIYVTYYSSKKKCYVLIKKKSFYGGTYYSKSRVKQIDL